MSNPNPTHPDSDSYSDSDSDSNSNSTILITRLVRGKTKWKEVLSFLTYPYSDDPSSIVDIDFPYSDFYNIHGHSHGLICLSDLRDVALFNSTTRELKKLPPSILPHLESDNFFAMDSTPYFMGFSYDPISNDFKVVRVVQYFQPPRHFYPPRVEIYNLSTDQWREIDITCSLIMNSSTPNFEMFCDGFYYWPASYDHKEYIQSFDMSKEVFHLIPLPENFEGGCDSQYRKFGVRNGSIVMFHSPANGDRKTFDIWAMKNDESGGVSWSKLFTICHVSGIERPLLFVNSDELLIEAFDGQVISYNVNTKDFKNLQVKGRRGNSCCFIFSNGLSSLKGGSRFDLGAAS